jgi:hypothetical protein
MSEINEVEGRLNTHEAVCAERYLGINARLKRLESILLGAAGMIIASLVAIAWQVASSR